MKPISLELRGITKHFGSIHALSDVSLSLKGGEVHGLCGHNGAGKSTLMKVLMGIVSPDSGEIVIDGESVRLRNSDAAHRHGLTIVDQELGLVPALSVEENLFLGNITEPFFTRRRRRRTRARALLEKVGLEDLDPSTPLSALLPGHRKLVELAHVLGHEARLMILDEPTAALSHAEARMVFDATARVVAKGAGVVFVSHRLDEVFEICDRISVLRDGRLVDSVPASELDRPELIRLMVGDVKAGDRGSSVERNGPPVKIENLSVHPRVDDLNLDVPAGTILGLAGLSGSGASDVLRGLAGLAEITSGRLTIGGRELAIRGPSTMSRRGVHYVTNDRKVEGLFFDHSVEGNLIASRLGQLARFGYLGRRVRRSTAAQLASRLAVRTRDLRQSVGELSGGNQQKVLIGRCLDRPGGELLLLDDPTRGVDVEGRGEIHELVREAARAGHAILFVSTELEELFDLADMIVTILGGRIAAISRRDDVQPQQVLAEMTHEPVGSA